MLGDDVELHAGLGVIDGHQAAAVAQAALVFVAIFCAEFAPIAAVMAEKGGLHFVGWNGDECAGCGDDAAKWELPCWRWRRAGLSGEEMDHVVMCGGAASAGGRMASV